MQAVIDSMIAVGGGSIVNISSQAGLSAFPGMVAYASTKWAVRGMTKSVALDLAEHNIRVNSVHPGIIDTPMLDANPKETLDEFTKAIPLRRLGSADEIANVVIFLASDASSYLTGAEIAATGGFAL